MTRVLAICLLAAVAAHAGTYRITVPVDASTTDDTATVASGVATLADGAELSRTLRRLTMGLVGEYAVALRDRLDADGNLRLDDGSTVALVEGDSVEVAGQDPTCPANDPTCNGTPHPGAVLISSCKDGHCRPDVIVVVGPDGNKIRVIELPALKARR